MPLDSVRHALADQPDLGSLPQVTIDQWLGLSADEKTVRQDIGITAIERFPGWQAVADQRDGYRFRAASCAIGTRNADGHLARS